MTKQTQRQINELSYQLQLHCLAADLHWRLSEEADEAGNENQSDIHYADYHAACEEIAKTLTALTGGAIDGMTARRMAHHKREQIQELYSRHTK